MAKPETPKLRAADVEQIQAAMTAFASSPVVRQLEDGIVAMAIAHLPIARAFRGAMVSAMSSLANAPR